MFDTIARLLREVKLGEFIGELIKYVLILAGSLTFLLILALLSLMQISYMPPGVSDVVTFILFLPIVLDVLVISPNLPYILVYVTLVPLFLIIIVILRIFSVEIAKRLRRVTRYFTPRREEKKYGFWTLLAVSLGATIGPSAFVLTPYSVIHYGYQALIGMILASVSAVLLAYGYAKMFAYSKKIIGGKYVGGPSFVRNAFGAKHYVYIIARFTMWIGNVALAAFNLLITIELLSRYLLPLVGVEVHGFQDIVLKLALFILLSVIVLLVYQHWEETVSMQRIITTLFLALFLAHAFFIASSINWTAGTLLAPIQYAFGQPDVAGLLWSILTSAAYVYLMVFGFQEVQSLAENVKASDAENPEKEVARKLMYSMILGAGISGLLFIGYMYLFTLSKAQGYAIPATPIPSLDMLRAETLPYLVTLTALLLGIMTTYIPAFVAALKHLRELLMDVFLVDMKSLKISVDPYIVIFFMGLLLLSNAEYIIRLTDFAVLISLIFVASAEYFLARRLSEPMGRGGLARIAFTTGMIALIAVVFSVEMREVAINSIIFMIFSTLAVMLFSYSLPIIEIFTIITLALSMVLIPPLIDVIKELAGYGLITPTQIAITQAISTSYWIIRLVILSLIFHILYMYRSGLKRALEKIAEALTSSIEERGLLRRR